MFNDFLANLSEVPKEVSFNDILEFERMEQRFFTVEQYYGDVVGMNMNSVEFCPNHKPPELQSEILPWLWVIHPEFKDHILEIADDQLKQLIREYNNPVNCDN